MNAITVITRRCPGCEQNGEVTVDAAEYDAYTSCRGLIQDVMPTTPAPIREQLMSGIHPDCFDRYITPGNMHNRLR